MKHKSPLCLAIETCAALFAQFLEHSNTRGFRDQSPELSTVDCSPMESEVVWDCQFAKLQSGGEGSAIRSLLICKEQLIVE